MEKKERTKYNLSKQRNWERKKEKIITWSKQGGEREREREIKKEVEASGERERDRERKKQKRGMGWN